MWVYFLKPYSLLIKARVYTTLFHVLSLLSTIHEHEPVFTVEQGAHISAFLLPFFMFYNSLALVIAGYFLGCAVK